MGGLKRNLARERGHGPKLSNPIFTHRVHGSASIAAERIAGESNRNVHERAALLAGKRASTLRPGYRSHTTHHLSIRDANKITQTPEDNKPTAPFAVEEVNKTEIMKIPGEVRRALRHAPTAEPPRPLPMAEAGETVQDASSVWDYLTGAGAPEPVREAFKRVCERAGVPYIIELETADC